MKPSELRKKLKLYLICGEGESRAHLPERVSRALEGGVTAVQLRAKTWETREIFETARDLRALTERAGALFILNDRVDIALTSGADGVHLGQKDLPIAEVRKIAPPDFVIGGTARTAELAKQAQFEGANYIGCGSAFPTTTKSNAVVIGPEGISEVLHAITIPGVAIGGIHAANVHRLAHCGCAGISLSRGIMGAPDPKLEAAKILEEIERTFEI